MKLERKALRANEMLEQRFVRLWNTELWLSSEPQPSINALHTACCSFCYLGLIWRKQQELRQRTLNTSLRHIARCSNLSNLYSHHYENIVSHKIIMLDL